MEQCWGASKNLWSSIWGVFYWLSGESFFNIYVIGKHCFANQLCLIIIIIGLSLLGFLTFVIANIFFVVLDLTGKPSALLQYKIQEDKGVPVSFNFSESTIIVT